MAPRDSQLDAPSTDPRLARKTFSGRAGAGGPGGAPFELGHWQQACDPPQGMLAPAQKLLIRDTCSG